MSDEVTWTMAVDPGESMSFDELRAVFRQFRPPIIRQPIDYVEHNRYNRNFTIIKPRHYLATIPRQEDLVDAVIDLKKRLAE